MGKGILTAILLCSINAACSAGLGSAMMAAGAEESAQQAKALSIALAAKTTNDICESNAYLIEALQKYREEDKKIVQQLIGGDCKIYRQGLIVTSGVVKDLCIGKYGLLLVTIRDKKYLTHINNVDIDIDEKEANKKVEPESYSLLENKYKAAKKKLSQKCYAVMCETHITNNGGSEDNDNSEEVFTNVVKVYTTDKSAQTKVDELERKFNAVHRNDNRKEHYYYEEIELEE